MAPPAVGVQLEPLPGGQPGLSLLPFLPQFLWAPALLQASQAQGPGLLQRLQLPSQLLQTLSPGGKGLLQV